MKSLYIDESGTYNQDIKKLNPDDPVFLLAGVIIGRKEENELTKEFIEAAIKAAQSEGSSAWLYASIWGEFGEMDEELFEVYKRTIPARK